ncbi:hypothetical protein CL658_05230 [bacterium]|nr:hypothetical protein [bacterium]|tara:strand:+ start:747 stop:1208 length:462 start_codon:yes stop_codon:yes gene_type:complete
MPIPLYIGKPYQAPSCNKVPPSKDKKNQQEPLKTPHLCHELVLKILEFDCIFYRLRNPLSHTINKRLRNTHSQLIQEHMQAISTLNDDNNTDCIPALFEHFHPCIKGDLGISMLALEKCSGSSTANLVKYFDTPVNKTLIYQSSEKIHNYLWK